MDPDGGGLWVYGVSVLGYPVQNRRTHNRITGNPRPATVWVSSTQQEEPANPNRYILIGSIVATSIVFAFILSIWLFPIYT